MKYESTILKRLIDTYGVVGNPRYISEIINEFIVRGKESFPNLFTYQADWLAHIDEFGLNPTYTVSYTGQSIYAPNTLEKPIKSAILKGQTLVNVALTQYMTPSNNASINGETITLDLSRQWSLVEFSKDNTLLIPNEVYTCILYDVVGDTTNVIFSIQNASSTKLYLKDVGYKFKFTMGVGNDLTNRLCYIENPVATSGTVSFRLVLLKGDYTNVDIPYFTGMQSVKMPVLTTTGKNLFNPKWLKNTETESVLRFEDDGSVTLNGALNSLTWFYLDLPKGTYQASSFNDTLNAFHVFWTGTDGFFETGNYFTLNEDTRIKGYITKGNYDNYNIKLQLETGTQKTSYEPFKSNILTVNEDVTLRSNGNVYDELDLLTGKLTQRIDENGEVLAQEIIKTVDLTILDQNGQNVKQLMSFNGGTHFNTGSLEGSLTPSVSVCVETDLEETLKVCSLEGNTM